MSTDSCLLINTKLSNFDVGGGRKIAKDIAAT